MKVLLPYRSNDYFNNQDEFIFWDDSYSKGHEAKGFFQSKVHFHNGSWYTDEKLNFKATTLRALRVKKDIHTTHGVYNCITDAEELHPMCYKTNGVDPQYLLLHIQYNIDFRWGRALIIDLETVYTGYLSADACEAFSQKISAKPSWKKTSCTAPYH